MISDECSVKASSGETWPTWTGKFRRGHLGRVTGRLTRAGSEGSLSQVGADTSRIVESRLAGPTR